MEEWNLDDIYKYEETEKLIQELKAKVAAFVAKKELLKPEIREDDFFVMLKESENISELSGRLSSYAGLKTSQDTSNQKALADEGKLANILTDLSNKTMFFSLWFKDLDNKNANRLINYNEEYKYYLITSRSFKDHMLSEKEEQIINLKDLSGADELTNIYDIFTNKFTYEFDNKTLSREELAMYVKSPKREERKGAYDKIMDKYHEERNVLGQIYKAIVTDWVSENVRLRNFKSAISVRNLSNDVSDKAVEALLNTVRKNNKVFQDYFKLKSKITKTKMDRYDLYMHMQEEKKEFEYEKSKEIVLNTYKEFSEEFYEGAKKIFDENHVHSHVKPNKRSGAFCWMVSPKITPYVLLNHVDDLESMYTMMHEFGHGIHDILSGENNYLSAHPTLPLAETASIFGEMLLSQKLLKESSNKTKIKVLIKMLDGQYASITRQAYFVMFEKLAHKKVSEGITIDELSNEYMNMLIEQFGDALHVPEKFKNEWLYIPHIYHTPFYCYAYAFGNLLVLALYNMYKHEGESFIPKMTKILKYGGSKNPAEILKEIGIDIEQEQFWQQGFDIITEEIKELERLSGTQDAVIN